MPAPISTPAGDPGADAASGLGRRTVLKGLASGAAGIAAFPLLAACSSGSKAKSATTTSGNAAATTAGSSATGATKSGGSTTFGSNASDAVPKAAYAAVVKAFQKTSGDTIKTNTVEHNAFQNKINNYLQGSPDHVFTWFAGYRMKYYAAKGLVAPMDDVWEKIGASNFGAGSPPHRPATTARSTSFPTTTTRGRFSTARACGRPRVTRCPRRSTRSRPCVPR